MLMYVLETLNLDSFVTKCQDSKTLKWIGVVVGVGATIVIVKRLRRRKDRVCGVDYPKDTVILHVGQTRGPQVPTLGHFCIKLQMYMNINKIPYKVNYEPIPGPKKKVPWIEYNGVTLGDSQFIIEYLNKEFNIDINKHLSPEEKAIAWGLQKWLEEFTYMLNIYTRWYILLDDFLNSGYLEKWPLFVRFLLRSWFMRRRIKKFFYTVGVGRHSNEEVFEMTKNDLRQLSTILGKKKYLMGGETPSVLDCTAFGQLSQIRWATPDSCPGKQLLTGELTNLISYMDRIKSEFWPNWDELLLQQKKL